VATFTQIINSNHTISTKIRITILVGFQIITNIGFLHFQNICSELPLMQKVIRKFENGKNSRKIKKKNYYQSWLTNVGYDLKMN